jgi:hypothetical protein
MNWGGRKPSLFSCSKICNWRKMEFVNTSIVLDLDGVIADIDTAVADYLLYNYGVTDEDYGSWFTSNTTDENALKLFQNTLF